MPKTYGLARSQSIARPLDEVFAFFSDAGNLETLTPPFLRFQIVTPRPIEIREGVHIEYRLSLHGIPVRWRSIITCFERNRRFIDEQVSGPYAYWRHVHEFEAERDGTRMSDIVSYRLPLGPLGVLVHALWVERQVRAIFDYRAQTILRLLDAV